MSLAGGVLAPRGVSKLPLGLLGFFGIKNGGEYPQEIGSVLVPTLELAQLFAVNYRELHVVSPIAALGFVTANLGTTGLPAVVPQNENWFVSSMSAHAFCGVGDSFTGTIEIRNTQSGSASVWHRALSSPIAQVASTTTLHPWTGGEGVWLGPGDTIGAWYAASTNATGTAQLSIQVALSRFPI